MSRGGCGGRKRRRNRREQARAWKMGREKDGNEDWTDQDKASCAALHVGLSSSRELIGRSSVHPPSLGLLVLLATQFLLLASLDEFFQMKLNAPDSEEFRSSFQTLSASLSIFAFDPLDSYVKLSFHWPLRGYWATPVSVSTCWHIRCAQLNVGGCSICCR